MGFIALDRPLAPATDHIELFIEFVKAVREAYRKLYFPRRKTRLPDAPKTALQNPPVFTLLKHSTGPFSRDQERFLIAAKFSFQSKPACSHLLGCLPIRKGKNW